MCERPCMLCASVHMPVSLPPPPPPARPVRVCVCVCARVRVCLCACACHVHVCVCVCCPEKTHATAVIVTLCGKEQVSGLHSDQLHIVHDKEYISAVPHILKNGNRSYCVTNMWLVQ